MVKEADLLVAAMGECEVRHVVRPAASPPWVPQDVGLHLADLLWVGVDPPVHEAGTMTSPVRVPVEISTVLHVVASAGGILGVTSAEVVEDLVQEVETSTITGVTNRTLRRKLPYLKIWQAR